MICNRCLFGKSVKKIDQGKYSVVIEELVTPVCLTCDRNIQKQETLAQALWSKLVIFSVTDVLSKFKQLEKLLIS